MGTPSYMAPEQVSRAQAVDVRADIFSLGCILYQLVTHQEAFPGDSVLEIFNAAAQGRYRDPRELVPDLPEAMFQGLRGALEPDLEARIPDCHTLRLVLSGQLPWSAETTSPPNFQLPACALSPVLLEEESTEPALSVPPVPSGLFEGAVAVPPAAPADQEGTLTVEAFQAAERLNRARVRQAAVFSALASAALVGLAWMVLGRPDAAVIPEASAPAAEVLVAEVAEVAPIVVQEEAATIPEEDAALAEEPPAAELAPAVSTPPPVKAEAQPAPAARAAARPSTGTVRASGDHSVLYLLDSQGQLHQPGALAPGSYDLVAAFPSGRSIERPAFLTVEAGHSYSVRCSALMENCR